MFWYWLAPRLLGWLVPAVLGALAVGWASNTYWRWRVAQLEQEHQEAFLEASAAVDRANQDLAKAAFRYEEWKARQQPKVQVVVREVTRVIRENPEWGGARLPDGVRNLANSAPSDIGAGESQPAVPALPATPDRSQW